MRSTLFFVPHEVLGIPLFGFGWALGFLLVAGVLWLVTQHRAGHKWTTIASGSWFWLIAAALVTVVLPAIEQRWPDGTPIGLPIRGYGLLVLLGLLSAIGITNIRAQRLAIHSDTIIGLAIWSMLGGVLGARLFYVVQKWDTFTSRGTQLMIDIVKLTEGGLVIYGGIIGGLVAIGAYCYRNRLNILLVGDLVVPGFFIGLAFGRIGCLLHGCCFGAVCNSHLPSIQFPHGSLPYFSQVERGQLLGLRLASQQLPSVVDSVSAGSPAESVGIKSGDQVRNIIPHVLEVNPQSSPASPPPLAVEVQTTKGNLWLSPKDLPAKSLPVHPSQIYSSVDAFLLCILTWFLQPLATRRGTVLFSGITLYALSRFLLEWIRTDEKGQFGTQLTIAQWIAIVSGIVSLLGLVYVLWMPRSISNTRVENQTSLKN